MLKTIDYQKSAGSESESVLTQASLPAVVLTFFGDRWATESQAVREQTWITRSSVGDGHQRLRGPHCSRYLWLDGLLPGALVEHLNHSVLLYDLGMEILYSGWTGGKWEKSPGYCRIKKQFCLAHSTWLKLDLKMYILNHCQIHNIAALYLKTFQISILSQANNQLN